MLVLEERGKLEYPEKNLSEQSRELTTNSTHICRRVRESNPGHIGGRRALSPLRHLCSPQLTTKWTRFFGYCIWNNAGANMSKETRMIEWVKEPISACLVFSQSQCTIQFAHSLCQWQKGPNKLNGLSAVKSHACNACLFLFWTGLRQSVPLKLRLHMPNLENILDLESLKCRD